jgi:phosphotriesterase-related protein
MTVKGPISPSELGLTSPHEHLFIDIEKPWLFIPGDPYKRAILDKPVTMDILGILRMNPLVCRDNLKFVDDKLALVEARDFRDAGGKTIVDVTNKYMGRNPQGLRRVSEAAGLNIVASTGFYIEPSHPPYVKKKNVDDLAAEMIEELTQGIDGAGIRAGLIGEIGTSIKVSPDEAKVLQASAKAHMESKAPIYVHVELSGRDGIRILDILERSDADLSKVVIGHCSDALATPRGMDVGYQEAMADRGAYLGYDTFGHEEYTDQGWGGQSVVMARDSELVAAIARLVRDGYLHHILMSTDVCFKIHLRSFGGWGVSHILRDIVPMLKRQGVSQEEVDTILIDNPRNLFS